MMVLGLVLRPLPSVLILSDEEAVAACVLHGGLLLLLLSVIVLYRLDDVGFLCCILALAV